MDDQGQSDKLCRSFVFRIFQLLSPFPVYQGLPLPPRLGKSTSTSPLSSAHAQLVFSFMELLGWEGTLEVSTPVPVGV